MMRKREEKRTQLKGEMDHFTEVYWDKKKRDAKATKIKDKNYQTFWVNYNKKLVCLFGNLYNIFKGWIRIKRTLEI